MMLSQTETAPVEPTSLDPIQSAPVYKNLLTWTVIAAVVLGIGYGIADKPTFFFAYLHGWSWALNITLGALFWNLIHHVTAAGWSVGHRRIFENMTRALPVLLILFIPILLGIGSVYKWVHASDLKNGKEAWLSTPFFTVRLGIYFAIWITYSVLLRKWSLQSDQMESASDRIALLKKMEWYAPSGLLLLGLTATFAAFDVVMSLNYHWFSTIFGVIYWADGIRASLALMVLVVLALRRSGYLNQVITPEHFHDIGKLSFGFTVFWAYVSFSQYFLYWYGNIPEETKFFVDRRYMETRSGELISSSWYVVSIGLAICYFAVPFFALLRRDCKRNPVIIGFVSAWILVFHCVHHYWEIIPESRKPTIHDYPTSGAEPNLWNAVSVVFFLSVLITCTLYGMRKAPLIPIRDPRLQESIHHEVDEFGDE